MVRTCRYCGDEYSAQGHKSHETHCPERAEEYRGEPPGIEDMPGQQARLGASLQGRSQPLTDDERQSFAEKVSESRRTT